MLKIFEFQTVFFLFLSSPDLDGVCVCVGRG